MAFTRLTKNVLNVSALPDRVQNQAQLLKATFDQAGVDIKAALNALMTELEAITSANNIGADVQSVTTKTVQAILTAFEEEIAERYTKTEADALIATGTNDLVADIDVNLTTGVITVTKKDGTVETFDTAIEKVPAKFEIVESGDTYLLKITNVDGTTTQTDVTNLMNIYNFSNSDYITFEVTGEGNEKTVTANIKANSIGLDKLSLSVVSTLEGYVNSAKDSATAAKTSETNAKASELNALEAKTTAVNKATEATTSATAAKASETNAAKSAEDAEYWAKQAENNGGGSGGITEIPVATADTLGGIKVGEGLEITEDGTLSVGGTDGGDGIKQTVLFSGKVSTENQKIILSESVENFDEIRIIAQYGDSAGTYLRVMPVTIISVDEIKRNGYNNSKVLYQGTNYVGADIIRQIIYNFTANNELLIADIIDSTNSVVMSVTEVVGIKLDNPIILDGAVNVDETPTEGSNNVVTSGGVKKYVDDKITYGTTDLTAGTSTLETGTIYLCYE